MVKFIKIKEQHKISVRAKKSGIVDQTITTSLDLPLSIWNNGSIKKGLKRAEFEHALYVKTELQRLEILIEFELNKLKPNQTIPKDWLKNLVSPPAPKKVFDIKDIDIKEYIKEYYIKDSSKKLAPSTIKRLGTVCGLLQRFDSKPLTLCQLDNTFKQNFIKWMDLNKYSKGYKNRILKYIKNICNHASVNSDFETNKYIKAIKVSFDDTIFITISKAEQEKIKNTVMPHPYLENAKKWLLISCLTGQRVSDFLNFNLQQITTINNKKYLEVLQQKTSSKVQLPVTNNLFELIKEMPRKISDVKYNKYIKEVCKISGLDSIVEGDKLNPLTNRKEKGNYYKWELVTSHIGRRSFATNNYGIIPTALLMRITGHTTEASFLKYINKKDEDIDKLELLFNALNK